MASTYTANTGIEKPGTGEQAGTWGDTTNNDFDIIDRALNGVGSISLSGTTHTLTTTDGTLSDGMYKVLVFGGSPSGTNTVTVSPNDQQKIFYAKNDSGESVVISQGSGASITINNGETRIVYCDGAGAGAAVVDLTATLAAGVPSGTKQLFVQTAAPTGWTKDTTHDDKAIRIVSGTVGTGGSSAFTTAFGTPSVSGSVTGAPSVGNLGVTVSGNISNHTLSINRIPSHSHSVFRQGTTQTTQASSTNVRANVNTNTGNAGGGGTHNHGHNIGGNLNGAPGIGNLALGSSTTSINVSYVDVIIAAKD